MEWKSAAERKKCDVLGKIQNCTEADKFMYHCVLNKDATMLLEVCAPMYYMSGYCARFSEVHKRIINDPGLDCTTFDPPCPARFQSSESYKYQACYTNRTKHINSNPAYHHQANQTEKDETTAAIVNAFLAIFVIITIALIILISVGYKQKWIEFTCGKKGPKDQKNDVEVGEEEQALVRDNYPVKVNEENEEANKRSIAEKRDAVDGFTENKSQENNTDQTTETRDTEGREAPVINKYTNQETRENCDKKKRLTDEKRVESGQNYANKGKESNPISVDRESDGYSLEKEKEKFEYFWQKHSVFSQWYPCSFVVDGIAYNCAEQYMMHQKAEIMGDEDSAEAIMTLDDPNEIKKRGRRVKNFNQDIWESCCQDIVRRGNMEKFLQNEELKQQLLWTYPKTLVEASPYDRIWGIGLSEDDPRAWNKLTWKGKNLLGEILTTVRESLRRDIENAGPYGNSNDLDL